ncbi:MAG: NADH-quinone oxidoreductase subunit J [Gammaproteobacteria bacterium]|nr:NADH-quinone oxidoreductase subunit J [Gammaproteobacteria bacterium]
MTAIELVFYLFSTVLTLSALAVITVRNAVYAALFLVLAFFSSAAIWMLLEVEFLAITLVLVYVGAVMVLFLFVVMMLDMNSERVREGFARYLPVGILVALIMAGELMFVIWTKGAEKLPLPPGQSDAGANTALLGERLYTAYLYPFEIAAVILLVGIVAAIALTHTGRNPNTRYQDPSRQVSTRREDRVRIVSMPGAGSKSAEERS